MMIRIDRSGTTCPEKLKTKGEEDLPRLRALAAANALNEKCFKRTIYRAPVVKSALWAMQSRKCCYCEGKYERKHSDVEHFRPKTEALRDAGLKATGYWWLAYRFENLYFGCLNCNRIKGAQFPLLTGTRALDAEEEPGQVEEFPLLIDPGLDHPEKHLTFVWIPDKGFEIAPRNGSERGQRTIEILELDRDDLSELRRDYYHLYLEPLLDRFDKAKKRKDKKALAQIRREARSLKSAAAPYALLARVALRRVDR